ncbi:MAG: c-type cytochrome [Rhodobacteraceae bacterium]|nr:c-type cytochrome [Paracoccaceae bacterium]TVR46767.1 MAG: MFS transporter [Paracoccaceae bacterium]
MSRLGKFLASSAVAGFMAAAPALADPLADALGLGRAALPEEIAAWDVAVMPDGQGLPPGHGDVWDGEDLWIDHCAACHGDFAEGAGAWPPIVGGSGTLTDVRPLKTVESYWPYLSTVWDYINRSMPFGAAQTLEVDEVYAITAYILFSAGLVDADFELTQDNFTEIRLPNEDGFYIDDRAEVEFPVFTQEPCMSDCRGDVTIVARATDLDVTPEFPVIRNLYSDPLHPEAARDNSIEDAAAQPVEDDSANEVQLASLDPELVAAGEMAWRQCRSCHQLGDGARNGAGPQLNEIVGAAVAGVDGFRYSPAFEAARDEGLVWDAEMLDTFLENPSGLIPRNRMSFRGVRDADERAALIAYLKSHTD